MMQFSESDIDRIVQIARLKASPEKRAQLLDDLNIVMGQLEIVADIDGNTLVAFNGPIHRFPSKSK